MAIILSVPQQAYTPRVVTITPTIPVNTRKLSIHCTRVGWPVGPVGSIEVTYPDGSPGPICLFDGGVHIGPGGTIVDSSGFDIEMAIGNQPLDLPNGQYTVKITVLQTITTAITVERF